MSENYLYLEDLTPPAAASPSRLEKNLKRLALALGLLLTGEALWFCAITPCLPLSSVELHYTGPLSKEALLAAAGISGKTSFIGLDAKATEVKLASLPSIASVTVTKGFPDKVMITLLERVPVASALAVVDGMTVPLSFDKDGVVFRVGTLERASEVSELGNLPLVSGLVFESPTVGMRLPAFLLPLLKDLEKIRQSQPALLGAISEIRVQKHDYEGYELTLYPVKHPIRVKIGSQLNEETLRYMMLVLDVLDSRGVRPEELDFRTGTASYRTKEASSG